MKEFEQINLTRLSHIELRILYLAVNFPKSDKYAFSTSTLFKLSGYVSWDEFGHAVARLLSLGFFIFRDDERFLYLTITPNELNNMTDFDILEREAKRTDLNDLIDRLIK